ncbi:MAG TPA: hypothetical protein VM582_06925 [Candidatus Thermoplasmatota archaeon]|nr:hypothetical protein [Candidatus Thermoplasmatota archaeon]
MALAEGWQVGIGGVVAAGLAWSLALLVLFLRPDRLSNRLLALLLAFEGAVSIGGVGLAYFTSDFATAYALQSLTFLAYLMIAPTELAFLGTLPGPLARPLSTRRARTLIALVAAAQIVAYFALHDLFIVLRPGAFGPGPAQYGFFILSSLVHLYALAVAVSA